MIAAFRKRSIFWSFIAAAVLIAAGCFALTEARKNTALSEKKPTAQKNPIKTDSEKPAINSPMKTADRHVKPLTELRIVVGENDVSCDHHPLQLTRWKLYLKETKEFVDQTRSPGIDKNNQMLKLPERKFYLNEIRDQIKDLGIDKNTVICVVPGEKVNSGLYLSVQEVVNSLPIKGIKAFNSKTGFSVLTPPYADRLLSVIGYTKIQPVLKEGKWGFQNQTDEMVIKPQFDQADRFIDGYAAVKLNGKWGYIDTTGNWTIRPSFDLAGEFREDRAVVKIDGKFGFIDKTGQIMIPPGFENSHGFFEGLAAVKMEEKWGFINKRGETIVPFQFDETNYFSDGLAAVQTGGKWGYINKKGDKVVPLVFKHADPFFEGLAAVQVDDSKFGFIDKNGRMVIDPVYDSVFDFNNGSAFVIIFDNPEKGIQGQGLSIDKAGNIISDEGERIKANQQIGEKK